MNAERAGFPGQIPPYRFSRVGLLAAGAILLLTFFDVGAQGYRTARSRADIDHHGVNVAATVVNLRYAGSSTSQATIQFVDGGGRPHTVAVNVDSDHHLAIGRTVEVVYDVRDPDRVHTVSLDPSVYDSFLGLVGGAVIVVLILWPVLRIASRRQRRERRLFATGAGSGRVRLEPWISVKGNTVATYATVLDAGDGRRLGVLQIPPARLTPTRDVDVWVAYGAVVPGSTVAFRAGVHQLLPLSAVKTPDFEHHRDPEIDRIVDGPLPWRDAREARSALRAWTATNLALPVVLLFPLVAVLGAVFASGAGLAAVLSGEAAAFVVFFAALVSRTRTAGRLVERSGTIPRHYRGAVGMAVQRRLTGAAGRQELAMAAGITPAGVDARIRFTRAWVRAWTLLAIAVLTILGIWQLVG